MCLMMACSVTYCSWLIYEKEIIFILTRFAFQLVTRDFSRVILNLEEYAEIYWLYNEVFIIILKPMAIH